MAQTREMNELRLLLRIRVCVRVLGAIIFASILYFLICGWTYDAPVVGGHLETQWVDTGGFFEVELLKWVEEYDCSDAPFPYSVSFEHSWVYFVGGALAFILLRVDLGNNDKIISKKPLALAKETLATNPDDLLALNEIRMRLTLPSTENAMDLIKTGDALERLGQYFDAWHCYDSAIGMCDALSAREISRTEEKIKAAKDKFFAG